MTDQDIAEIARKITIEIMKERSMAGAQRAKTLEEWEIYIWDVIAAKR
jgi:hypothetical protein